MGGGGEQMVNNNSSSGVESSMEVVLRDGGVVSNIVSKLRTARDRYAAALVCRLWHDAVTWQATKLALRTRASLPHLVRPFKHIVALDLSCIDEELTDSDLEFCAMSFGYLRWLSVGHVHLPQDQISDAGLLAFAERCGSLEQLSLAGLSRIGDYGIRAFSSSGTPFLRSLTLESCRNLTDDALAAISDFPSLVELQLKGEFGFTSTGLAKIGSNCNGLVKVCLDLGSTNIDPALNSLAEGCPKLQELSLKFKKANLRELVKCTSLSSLVIESDQRLPMDGPVLAIATANKNLKEFVYINVITPLTDSAVIGVVLKCPMLERLSLEATGLTGSALLCIVNCKTLQHLTLENMKSTEDGLAEIGMCGRGLLKNLALRNARGVRDMEIQSLMNRNRGLEFLDLQSCHEISPIGFAAIAACRNLQILDLSYTEVDDLSLLTIASGVHNLQQLILIRCKSVTNMGAVARFSTLECLNVDQCPFVSDQGLKVLAMNCSRLTHLGIAFTQVTDIGLSHLCGCSLLRSIRVSYCRFVKGEGVVNIARACGGFEHVSMSHRFRESETMEALKEQSCRVTLEMDEMALVPFGYNLLMDRR
ncbi:unnamed protein product [Calypogeia fissa]